MEFYHALKSHSLIALPAKEEIKACRKQTHFDKIPSLLKNLIISYGKLQEQSLQYTKEYYTNLHKFSLQCAKKLEQCIHDASKAGNRLEVLLEKNKQLSIEEFRSSCEDMVESMEKDVYTTIVKSYDWKISIEWERVRLLYSALLDKLYAYAPTPAPPFVYESLHKQSLLDYFSTMDEHSKNLQRLQLYGENLAPSNLLDKLADLPSTKVPDLSAPVVQESEPHNETLLQDNLEHFIKLKARVLAIQCMETSIREEASLRQQQVQERRQDYIQELLEVYRDEIESNESTLFKSVYSHQQSSIEILQASLLAEILRSVDLIGANSHYVNDCIEAISSATKIKKMTMLHDMKVHHIHDLNAIVQTIKKY